SEFSERQWTTLSDQEKQVEADKMEVYAAMIDRIDQNVGRIVAKLKQEELFDNTLIMIMSDNGASDIIVDLPNDNDSATIGAIDRWVSLGASWANVSNTPFRYFKNYSYEGGIRTPFIVHWPEQVSKQINRQSVVHFIDIMPTLLELSDGYYPDTFQGEKITTIQGESIVEAFKSGDRIRQNPLYFEWQDGQALRTDTWKIVRQGKQNGWELYDMANDPVEAVNLADHRPDVLQHLVSEFNEWKLSIN
ncbi:MAG: sulfatase-like hydrolase/transferase, partial [Bacteroidota bacterium]